jgi:hypothetical protein
MVAGDDNYHSQGNAVLSSFPIEPPVRENSLWLRPKAALGSLWLNSSKLPMLARVAVIYADSDDLSDRVKMSGRSDCLGENKFDLP